MSNTEFARMKKALARNGWFVINRPDGSRTEVLFHNLQYGAYYAVYHISKPSELGVVERNCIDTSHYLDNLRYLF